MKIRMMRYSGSKLKYVNIINRYIDNSNSETYIEPFVGSGAVLFNLNKKFKRYIINDSDRNIIRIYKSIRKYNYHDYITINAEVVLNFGDIKNNKESYYNFRNWFNAEHWKTDTDIEGIYLHILANSCINSLLRFGPNGMNQSYGARLYTMDQPTYQYVNKFLQNVEIYNEPYQNILNNYKGLLFLDPPYYSQASSYSGFTAEDLKEFINLIKDKEYVYTDIINDYNRHLKNEVIRNMVNTAPSSNKAVRDNVETLFYNKLTNNKLF